MHLRPSRSCCLRCILGGSMYPALRLPLALTFVAAALAGPVIADDAVVGTGTPISCGENALDTALSTVQSSGGGTITFNCGGPHVIVFNLGIRTIKSQVVIDGGGVITLNGGTVTRLFDVEVGANLGLRNITVSNGYAAIGAAGAIYNLGTLHLVNATFLNNRTSDEGGPGGAIVSYGPVTAVNSRFENNAAADGGAVFLGAATGIGTFTNTTFKDNTTLSATGGWGGAILLWDGAQLTVRGCDFEGNSARIGGAIHNQFANVEVAIEQGTIIRSNTAREGGGLWLQAGTTVIEKSLIAGNRAEVAGGGGIYHDGGTLTIIDSTISENEAVFGGGLFARNGVTAITGATLVGNSAGDGGGIYLLASANAQLDLLNSTLSDNTIPEWYDSGSGAAIYASARTGATAMAINLRYVTISTNVLHTGVALDVNRQDSAVVTLALANSVLAASNMSTMCRIPASIASAATARYSLWSDTSCSFGTSEQNHPNTPAALGPLANNGGRTLTHAPLAGSPLIDNGICLTGVTTDQRGAHRLHGPACDIGSVEASADFPDSIFSDRFQ